MFETIGIFVLELLKFLDREITSIISASGKYLPH